MRCSRAIAVVLCALPLGACVDDPAPKKFAGWGPPLSGADADSGAPVFGDAGPTVSGCVQAATLVYVTGTGDRLYSFYPPTQTFTLVGAFDCLSSPTHMTVDRQGFAWVVAGGRLFKASTTDASCVAVPTWKPDVTFDDFSLTFVGVDDAPDTSLYVLNGKGQLGRFDVPSAALSTVGAVEPSRTLGDMTSNGDGSLYYLDDVATPVLWNFDPATAATRSSHALTAQGGGSQALAFWGGVFYAFENSQIYAYDPAAQTTKVVGVAPLQVTGAGQSTCVPKLPPQ